jgi:hypothetical protein
MDIDKSLEILEIQPDVSSEEIKKAYKNLVSVWHPDRFAQNPELQEKAQAKLKEINLAYETLQTYQPVMKRFDQDSGNGNLSPTLRPHIEKVPEPNLKPTIFNKLWFFPRLWSKVTALVPRGELEKVDAEKSATRYRPTENSAAHSHPHRRKKHGMHHRGKHKTKRHGKSGSRY